MSAIQFERYEKETVIKVSKHSGKKCPRCWKYHKQEEDLCHRCTRCSDLYANILRSASVTWLLREPAGCRRKAVVATASAKQCYGCGVVFLTPTGNASEIKIK